MEDEKEALEKSYQEGLTLGIFIGGCLVGAFIFLLMYLFPLCNR